MSRGPRENENSMIDDILFNFDFKKCHQVMNAINWEWGIHGQIPTIEMLKSSARQRLTDAMTAAKSGKCSKSTYFSSSGGLKGNAWVNRYGHIEGIRLEFVLTDWDSDGDV